MKFKACYIIPICFIFTACNSGGAGAHGAKKNNESQENEMNFENRKNCFLGRYQNFLSLKKETRNYKMMELVLLGSEAAKACRIKLYELNPLGEVIK